MIDSSLLCQQDFAVTVLEGLLIFSCCLWEYIVGLDVELGDHYAKEYICYTSVHSQSKVSIVVLMFEVAMQ